MPAAPDWAGRLAPGERLIWQGAPQVAEGGILSRLDQAALHDALYSDAFARVALFMIFAVFWIVITKDTGAGFVLIGWVLLIGAPVAALSGPFVRDWRLRRTFYALTDRRALMVWRPVPFWAKVLIVPMRSDIKLRFDGGDPGSIRFAADSGWAGRVLGVPEGFECLTDALRVFVLVEGVQRALANGNVG
jgi:hypothetical protein